MKNIFINAPKNIKNVVLGKGRDPQDPSIFHKLSLMAFFAWVGLGSDGLTSSCYGPAEVMLTLGQNTHLGLFVAFATVITIAVVSTSYSQIIELFPSGGGGYLVASKLLSPVVGMISGCALMIDYVLTISVSIASGAEAFFSFLPAPWQEHRLAFAVCICVILSIMNMRGVKESVVSLVPIFLIFLATHVFIILYAIITHLFELPQVVHETSVNLNLTVSQFGFIGTFFILIHAYSMGAGTFTGIEAVSNGMPVLKEPKIHTAKKTMVYMATSLAFTVFGLILSYVLFDVAHQPNKTLNAVLFEAATSTWDPSFSLIFTVVTLISEALLLFVAAQTGFIDGPRILSNMALDRWVPTKFASLSDRLVTQKGILMMGIASIALMILSHGSVTFLIVLYSINVFITFSLSQLGMVRHWWQMRKEVSHWKRKIAINGIGLTLCSLILIAVIIVKFDEGGWITILITGSLISLVLLIRRHYNKTGRLLKKLDSLIFDTEFSNLDDISVTHPIVEYNPSGRTAVLLVNGFSGLGIHSLLTIFRIFGDSFKNFVFMQVGIIDAGSFKGTSDIEGVREKVQDGLDKYIKFMNSHGYYAEAYSSLGLDIVEEIMKLVPKITSKFRNSVFFGGQVVFPNDTFITRLLHNYTVFIVQRKLYHQGIEFMILPIKMRT
jgi:amino acid transporter